MLGIMFFDPCENMPLIDFFRREYGSDFTFTYDGEKLYVKAPEYPEEGPEFDWDYGSFMRTNETWELLLDYLGILEHFPPCVCEPQCDITVTGEKLESMKTHTITVCPEVATYNTGVRKPYYRLRGKPVTPVQKKLMEDMLDFEWDTPSNTHLANFGKFILDSGEIYENGITGKYPHIGEYITDAMLLAGNFPFLDVIIAITDWDEIPEYAWDSLFEHLESDPFGKTFDKDTDRIEDHPERWNFEDHIVIGIHIFNGNVEIVPSETAVPLYKEYNTKYKPKNFDF